jgi:hypothetical protein
MPRDDNGEPFPMIPAHSGEVYAYELTLAPGTPKAVSDSNDYPAVVVPVEPQVISWVVENLSTTVLKVGSEANLNENIGLTIPASDGTTPQHFAHMSDPSKTYLLNTGTGTVTIIVLLTGKLS